MKDGSSKICTPQKEMVGEHKSLVRILRKGSKGDLKREAKKQAGELKEYRAHKGRKTSRR